LQFDPQGPVLEAWVGADATSNAWSLYSGGTYAPFGSLFSDGWRMRVVGGYGQYRYQRGAETIHGQTSFTDALIGYQIGLGSLTVKAFAGIAADTHALTPFDPDNSVSGDEIGWKVGLEGWLNLTATEWVALDLSYGRAHETYSARVRAGHKLLPELSFGLEAGAHGNAEYDGGRLGGFVRYEWAGGEASLAAGVSGDIAEPTNPYITAGWMTRF
jgi:opacity protein-like surface antigen